MKSKHLTFCGVLTAAALSIFIAEAQLPGLIPVPGVKPGLSNIVTLFALLYLSPKEALGILLSRICLGCLLTGSPITLIYSMSGGLACFAAEYFLLRRQGSRCIWGISAAGAMVHNTIQILTACLITKTLSILWYLPVLLISGILTGLFTGLCIWYLNQHYGQRIRRWTGKK